MSETEDKIVVPADKPEISKKVKVDLEVTVMREGIISKEDVMTWSTKMT